MMFLFISGWFLGSMLVFGFGIFFVVFPMVQTGLYINGDSPKCCGIFEGTNGQECWVISYPPKRQVKKAGKALSKLETDAKPIDQWKQLWKPLTLKNHLKGEIHIYIYIDICLFLPQTPSDHGKGDITPELGGLGGVIGGFLLADRFRKKHHHSIGRRGNISLACHQGSVFFLEGVLVIPSTLCFYTVPGMGFKSQPLKSRKLKLPTIPSGHPVGCRVFTIKKSQVSYVYKCEELIWDY